MDNLDSLFNKKEYELILDLTKDSQDPKELLMRVSCLIILGESDKALDEIEKNQSIIEKRYQLRLMKLHFELLFADDLYDEAFVALKHYQDLPYVSQEVEEFMQEVDYKIKHPRLKSASRTIEIDEIFDILEKETDQGKISQCLSSLKTYNINIYIDSLKIFMLREDVHPNFITYALILLVTLNYDKNIKVRTTEGIIDVIPEKLTIPFGTENYNSICEKIIEKSEKDSSLRETAIHLFNCFIIDTFPFDAYKDDCEKLASAFILIGKEYLGIDTSSIDEDLLNFAHKIKAKIESTPEIRL